MLLHRGATDPPLTYYNELDDPIPHADPTSRSLSSTMPSGGNQQRHATEKASIYDGIHGLFREWGCGHGNMQTPHTILAGGNGAIIVDIGLGTDAAETIDAVLHGFTVLTFEPMPENMASIQKAVGHRNLGSNVQFVQLEKGGDGAWIMPPLHQPSEASRLATGHGFAFIIHAGVGDEDSTMMLPLKGTRGAMGSLALSNRKGDGLKPVPQVRLDTVLPAWASSIHLLKIDTQGYELKILRGAMASLRTHRFRHVLYEFSPWLMI